MKKLTLLCALFILLPACTWVKLTSEGEKVRVLSAEEVKACKKMGKTVVTSKDKVAGFERSDKKLQKELEDLARNSAVDIDGDTVVPASEIKGAKQTFHVYRCVPPANGEQKTTQ